MRTKLLTASLVLVFVFAAALSLGFTRTATADSVPLCDCVLIYCIDPPGQVYLMGLLHPGERHECQPSTKCTPHPCD